MYSKRQLLIFDELTPYLYLQEVLSLYPYDIEEALVYSLLKPNPIPNQALLSFIDYIRHIRKYRILKEVQNDWDLHDLFTNMCQVSQRNQMVLHLHQFQFNASLYTHTYAIHNPYAHLPLEKIKFIDHIDLHIPPTIEMSTPYVDNTISLSQTFIYRDLSIEANHYFALSIQIADSHGILFIPRSHVGFLCTCASLYQICTPRLHNDFFFIFSLASSKETMEIYYDITNEMHIGLLCGEYQFDNFAYLKNMVLTLYNSICLKKHDYPIHAAMLTLKFPTQSFGLLLCGEQHSGKSEILNALLHLCDQHGIAYEKVFDDQGTLHYLDRDIYATGTEIGAYIGVDDLPNSSIFENLSASIILQVHKRTTHFLIPFTTHEESKQFHKVDLCVYLDKKTKKKGYENLDDLAQTLQIFQGNDTLPFFNPLTIPQHHSLYNEILEEFLNIMFMNTIEVGVYYTRHSPHMKEYFYGLCAHEIFSLLQKQLSEN